MKLPAYSEVVTACGDGTLVIGIPLWFAVLPLDPSIPDHGTNDFVIRTRLELREVGEYAYSNQVELKARRSDEHNAGAYGSLSVRGQISGIFDEAYKRSGIPDSEIPSFRVIIQASFDKFRAGTGPSAQLVTAWMNVRNNVGS